MAVSAVKGGWCQVVNGASVGYVPASQLSNAPVAQQAQVPTVPGYARADGVKVYASYSTASEVMATLVCNQEVAVSAVKGGWCQVVNGASVGYVPASQLSNAPVAQQMSYTAYVARDGACVYAHYSAASPAICALPRNFAVTVSATSGGWARVHSGGNMGYMPLSDLTTSPVAAQQELSYGDKGEAVKTLQSRLRELGYFYGEVGGNYLEQTRAAVQSFQSAAGLSATGVANAVTLQAMFAQDAPRHEAVAGGAATPASGTAVAMDWWDSDIRQIFARGTVAKITDVTTGISWYEKRTGGTNHADVQPLTAADTAAMKRALGGSWSWNRRPIFVTINGVNYAASMNGMPHGSDSISGNNFDGHHCIHFTNSRTHGSNRVDGDHQDAIREAARATL